MKKFFKWALIVVLVLGVVLFGLFKYMQYQTKEASPEEVAEYNNGGKKIRVAYSSPSKRGRIIFDSLVAYGEVWRTGANEATTFETSTDLLVADQKLPAGKYTLWTIPGREEWTVIFNSKMYGWGMGFDGKIPREPEHDALQVKVPAQTMGNVQEKFLITFEETPTLAMVLAWDKTKVSVPIK